MFELIILGSSVGLLSGFFGIGGGTILVPLLLILGYETKIAIGISILQMLFSSVFGSYINNKNGTLDKRIVLFIGFGGFIGALLSGFIASLVSAESLEIVFLSFASFALLRMFFHTSEHKDQKEVSDLTLLLIGIPIGTISMTIGVGGSIILIPVLVGFLHIPLKKAISAGLFFVVFSSVAGLISHAMSGYIDYESGITIGVASLIGVYFGIQLKDKVDTVLQKRLLIGFYLFVVLYLVKRIFF
jgi:uncharacterized membrane protein YfcA